MPNKQRSRRGIPLRVVVTTPFLVLLAGTVGLTGWLLIDNGLRAANQMSGTFSSEAGDRVRDYVSRYLETAHLVNDLNADAVLQGELGDWGSDKLGRHFWHQLQRFPELSFVFLGTRHGGAAGAGRLEDGTIVVDTTPADPELGLVRGTRREFRVIGRGGRGEQIRATESFDARERPWYRAAVERGGPVWSEVYSFFRDGETLAIAASRPVYDPSGELWGVLAVDLSLDRIGDFLRGIDAAERGQVFVMEPSGALVATSTGEPVMRRAPDGAVVRRLGTESAVRRRSPRPRGRWPRGPAIASTPPGERSRSPSSSMANASSFGRRASTILGASTGGSSP